MSKFKNKPTPSIQDRVYRQLNKAVERGESIHAKDTSAYCLYMASLLGVKVTTVERCFRRYKATKLDQALINYSPASANSTANNNN